MKLLLFSKRTELESHIEETSPDAKEELLDQIVLCLDPTTLEEVTAQLNITRQDSIDFFVRRHIKHYKALEKAKRVLEHTDHTVVLRQGDLPPLNTYTHLVSLGGDGTLLDLSFRTDLPILGVKYLQSSVGHYCSGSIDEFKQAVEMLQDGTYRTVKKRKVNCEIDGERLNAMNEFVVGRFPGLRIVLQVGDRNDFHTCTNLIISTREGQTAYYRDAGGEPFLTEDSNSRNLLAYLVNDPISGKYALPVNGFAEEIRITSKSNNAVIVPDALMKQSIVLRYDDEVRFFMGDNYSRLIKPLKNHAR
jgi:NAD kinase